ncbi:MAG: hypothetical protein H6Q05_705 [Acidobacteria bacterium]|nr:hypothetical protein [Acidobacteriota bacterium]
MIKALITATLPAGMPSCIFITGGLAADVQKQGTRRLDAMIHRYHEILRSARAGTLRALLFAVIICIWGGAVQSSSQVADVETVLRKRISEYYDAMQRGDYEVAANYIQSDSRKMFIFRIPKGPITRWKIESLKFSPEKTVCDTVVIVGRPIPMPLPGVDGIPDFPLQNQWVLDADGEWYLKLPWKEGENPMLQLYKGMESSKGSLVVSGEKPPAGGKEPQPEARSEGSPQRLIPDPANPASIHIGEKATYRYHYLNNTGIPIKVLSAHGDCHCTSVQQENPVITPGQTGTLQITVDTFGLPLGDVQKQVSVRFSDNPDAELVTLRIKTIPNFVVTPQIVNFGLVKKGLPAERKVQIVNGSGRAVKIIQTYISEPQFTLSLDKTELGPGENLVIIVRCDPTQEGEFADRPMIRTDLAAEPLINLSVRVQIVP